MNLFLSAMMEYGIWNQIFEWVDNLENVCLVSTSFRNCHTSELKADLLGGFAKFRAEMHSLVKAVAQIWAEKAGISQSQCILICSVRVGLYVCACMRIYKAAVS